MSWIKENKFLAGFTAVTVVGAGTLGFLFLQAKGRYDEAEASYEQESAELTRLQGLQPFPNTENLRQLDEQKKALAVSIAQLQQSLAKVELPLEQVSPQQFQDKLRTTVDSINQKANEAGVKHTPEIANLGFDRYLSEPPRPEASASLARQLKAIEILVGDLIKNRVAEIREISREELPEERSGRSGETESGKPGAKSGKSGELVQHSAVHITFLADQRSAISVINEIVGSKDQFFIPRIVSFKNEKEQGPLRNDPATAAAMAAAIPAPSPEGAVPGVPAAPISGTPAALPGTPAQRIIVGEEKIEVAMRIEIVDFAEPATTASK